MQGSVIANFYQVGVDGASDHRPLIRQRHLFDYETRPGNWNPGMDEALFARVSCEKRGRRR